MMNDFTTFILEIYIGTSGLRSVVSIAKNTGKSCPIRSALLCTGASGGS